MFKFCIAATFGGLFACVAGGAAAAGKADTSAAGNPPTVAESGMKAYVDPETGGLVSKAVTPAQARAAALPAPDMSKIQEIRHADGSIEWLFNGQSEEAMVVSRQQDGSLKLRCGVHGVIHDHETTTAETANDR